MRLTYSDLNSNVTLESQVSGDDVSESIRLTICCCLNEGQDGGRIQISDET